MLFLLLMESDNIIKADKPIWIGPKLHKIIKIEAAKKEITMRQFLAILLMNYEKGEKLEKQQKL